MNEIWGKEPLALKMGRGHFGYKNVVAFSDAVYQKVRGEILPLKTGIDPVDQLAGRISRKLSVRSSLEIAGFICPFYEIDETKLEYGFGTAISGIGIGGLEDFPRYQKKFDKFLKLVAIINQVFDRRMNLSLKVLMGDTGVINARTLKVSDAEQTIDENIKVYETYMHNNYSNLRNLNVSFIRFSDITGNYSGLGESLSDLNEDGQKLHKEQVTLATNRNVLRKIKNEQLESMRKGISVYEPFGFMLNYGLAGMILRNMNTDILIGTDAPGSYMNYLYHAFITPEELLVIVPK